MKFKFGVRGHDLVSKGSVEELASKLSKYNFSIKSTSLSIIQYFAKFIYILKQIYEKLCDTHSYPCPSL